MGSYVYQTEGIDVPPLVSWGESVSSSLQRIYKKHNIRFKLIQRVKKVIDFTNPEYKSMFMTMVELLESASKERTPTAYLDEAVFTFSI